LLLSTKEDQISSVVEEGKSLVNLEHKKQCPLCGKKFGNAKRGRCGGDNGECSYEFILSKRAKLRSLRLPKISARAVVDVNQWTSIQQRFKGLVSEVGLEQNLVPQQLA